MSTTDLNIVGVQLMDNEMQCVLRAPHKISEKRVLLQSSCCNHVSMEGNIALLHNRHVVRMSVNNVYH